MAQWPPELAKCVEVLERRGLLMLQDERFPSVATIVAGAPVKGSWWGHRAGRAIFNTSQALEDARDVTAAKLLDGKVTYIHRKLWSDLRVVGEARDAWQVQGLSPGARALLRAADKAGTLRTDLAAAAARVPRQEIAKAALGLERRLLVHALEVHTPGGAHAKQISTWRRWAEESGVQESGRTAREARVPFDEAVAALNHAYKADARLPWARVGLTARP